MALEWTGRRNDYLVLRLRLMGMLVCNDDELVLTGRMDQRKRRVDDRLGRLFYSSVSIIAAE